MQYGIIYSPTSTGLRYYPQAAVNPHTLWCREVRQYLLISHFADCASETRWREIIIARKPLTWAAWFSGVTLGVYKDDWKQDTGCPMFRVYSISRQPQYKD